MSLATDIADVRNSLESAVSWLKKPLEQHLPALEAAAAAAEAADQAAANDPLAVAVASASNIPAEARVLAAKVITDLAAMYPAASGGSEPVSNGSEGDTQPETPAEGSQDATDASQAPADAA